MLSSFLSVDRSCRASAARLKKHLTATGLSVLQTFDLHSARLAHKDCPCPNHGTDRCECQMIVLLIHGTGSISATLILHGDNHRTWLSLIDGPVQPAEALIQEAIQRVLQVNPSKEGL